MSDDESRISPQDCFTTFNEAADALSRHDALVDVDRRIQHDASTRLHRELELDFDALNRLNAEIDAAVHAPAQPANTPARTPPAATPTPQSIPPEVIQRTYHGGLPYASSFASTEYPFIFVEPDGSGGLRLCAQPVTWKAECFSSDGHLLGPLTGRTHESRPELLLLQGHPPNTGKISLSVEDHRIALFSSMGAVAQSVRSAVDKLQNIPLLRYANWPNPCPGIILVPNGSAAAAQASSAQEDAAEAESVLDSANDEETRQTDAMEALVEEGSSEGETPESTFHDEKIDKQLRKILADYMKPNGPFETLVTQIANENPLQPGSSRVVGKLRALADEESKQKGAVYRSRRDELRKIVAAYLAESGINVDKRKIPYGQVLDALDKFEDAVQDLLTYTDAHFAKMLSEQSVLPPEQIQKFVERNKEHLDKFENEYSHITQLIRRARNPAGKN